MWCKAVFGVLVALFASWMYTFLIVRADILKTVVSLNDNNCKLLTAPDLIGAEDLVRVREGVYVTGTDDRAKVWVSPEHGPANTPSGALFAVRTADGHVERVRISGMPEVDFHPHGLFYAAHLDLLYVVNHAYGRGGERIEIFKIIDEDNLLISMTHVGQIVEPLFQKEAMGILNDLVVLQSGSKDGAVHDLYVTRYMPFADPMTGRAGSRTPIEMLQHAAELPALTGLRTTVLYHCRLIADGLSTSSCTTSQTGFGMANGISSSANGDRLLVNDVVLHELTVWRRDSDNGKLRLDRSISMTHAADNIERESDTTWTLGTIPVLLEGFTLSGNAIDETLTAHSGMTRITYDPRTDSYAEEVVLVHNGALLSASACAIHDHGFVYLGSWARPGILQCKV